MSLERTSRPKKVIPRRFLNVARFANPPWGGVDFPRFAGAGGPQRTRTVSRHGHLISRERATRSKRTPFSPPYIVRAGKTHKAGFPRNCLTSPDSSKSHGVDFSLSLSDFGRCVAKNGPKLFPASAPLFRPFGQNDQKRLPFSPQYILRRSPFPIFATHGGGGGAGPKQLSLSALLYR